MGKRKEGRFVTSEEFAEFFRKNHGLVRRAVENQKKKDRRLNEDDLFAAGMDGIFRGEELYEPGKGCKETTYCMNWIRSKIQRFAEKEARRWEAEPTILYNHAQEDGNPLIDSFQDEKSEDPLEESNRTAQIKELKGAIRHAHLNPTERRVLRLFRKGLPFKKIAEEIGLTRMAVYLSFETATVKLKKEIEFRRFQARC